MDKYQVLFLLIVYYIVITVTTAVFSSGTLDIMSEQSGAWGTIKLIFGGLILDIPMVPLILKLIIAAPFWILLGYFIYLNLPKVAASGTPQP